MDGLAQDIVGSYQKFGDNQQGFVFCSTIEQCYELQSSFDEADIRAEVIEGNTDKDDRDRYLQEFRRGDVQLLINIHCLTEGLDVPEAAVCLLARNVTHVSTFLQMVGRVLRAAPGKKNAILIDLPGVTHTHGFPTEDRRYSLDGKGIGAIKERAIRVCLQCGYTYEGGPECPSCGFEFKQEPNRPQIYSAELRKVWQGMDTPIQHKIDELRRLRETASSMGVSLSWVFQRYKETFFQDPPISLFPEQELKREYYRLVGIGASRGYKAGFAKARFRSLTGKWPGYGW